MNRKRHTLLIALTCLMLALLGIGGVIARKPTSQLNIGVIRNRTASIKLVSLNPAGEIVTLTMKNASKKTVTTVVLGNSKASQRTDFSRDDFVPPGGTFSLNFIGRFKEELVAGQFELLAAIYNDDSSEGDQQAIEQAFQWRAGVVKEARAIKGLIDSVRESADPDLVQALKARIEGTLHPHDNPELKAQEKTGAHGMRERVGWMIEDHEKARSGGPDLAADSTLLLRISNLCDSQISLYGRDK